MKIKKIIGGLLVLSFMLGPSFASAVNTNVTTTSSVTSTNSQIQALLEQIKSLQAQVLALQAMQTQMLTASTNVSDSVQLIRSLKEGMSGEDIAALQAILIADPTIFPNGTIDGVFGSSTREALKKFQKKYGYEQVGYVGPKTLKQLNKLIKELGLKKKNSTEYCIKVPPGHLIAPGLFKTDDNGKKMGQYKFKVVDCDKITNGNGGGNNTSSTTPWISNTASNSVAVGGTIYDRATLSYGNAPTGTVSFQVYAPGDTTCAVPLSPAPSSATVNGNGTYTSGNFTATTSGTYRFIASYSGDSKNKPVSTACNASGSTVNVTTVADTSAPVISGISTSNLVSSTTSVVSWSTNEGATSKVLYSTSAPVNNSSSVVSDSTLVTSHSVQLPNLTPSSTYYFVVVSTDSAGNTATSSQSSFTTPAPVVVDTTAPVISLLGTANLLGTTTSVTWSTNEASNSKIWFGTTTPVVTTGTANLTDANFVTSHSLPLTGLATSTTYYFVVTSADSAGNTATSTQGSFVTTAGL